MATDEITPHSLRFERLLNAPLEKVWRFLVEPELRARWFMAGPTDLRVGGTIGMSMRHDALSDDNVPTPERYQPYLGHAWEERITRLEPPHLLAFTWENGEAGEVCIELTAVGNKTRLLLTHTGLRGPEDAVDFGGGWLSHLAALERRIVDQGVPNYWLLHDEAEAAARAALLNPHARQ